MLERQARWGEGSRPWAPLRPTPFTGGSSRLRLAADAVLVGFYGLKLGLGSLDLRDESRREVELASRLDDEDVVVFVSFFFRDLARQGCVAAVGVQHRQGIASTEDGALEGEDGSQVGRLPHEWYLIVSDVAEVVEENVEGMAQKGSRVFRSQRFWSVVATQLAEDDGVCVGDGAGREQY